MKQGRVHRRAGTSTVKLGRSSHAIPTNGAITSSARSRNPTVCIDTTREAGERSEHPPGLSPPDSGCGTECSKAVRQWSGSLAAAKRSGVQQTANGRSQANPRRQSACAGAWAKWKPSLAGCEPHLPPEKRSWSAGIVRQSAQSADVLVLVVPPLQGL